MHDQGNYTIQVGQDPYARPPAFQQHLAASMTHPTSHYGPLATQSQVIQQGRPSFHPTEGISAYWHTIPSIPHQGPTASVVSVGLGSTQSYSPHHRMTGPNACQLSSPQGHTLERGPYHQPLSHATSPAPPTFSSSSSALISDAFGFSVLPMREHPLEQSMIQVLPPPPPPLPPSLSPKSPPLQPPSPPPDILSKRYGGCSLKGLLDENNLMMNSPPPVRPSEDRSAHETNVPVQRIEKIGLKVGSAEAVIVHSPADSDMDMEDDITYPDEEKKNCLSNNSDDEKVSISQEDLAKEHLQPLQHAGGHRLPEISVHGNFLFAEASVTKAQGGGSEIASDCNFPVMKITSEADDSLSEKLTGYGKLSDQVMEGANPFKPLHGYSSDNTTENEEENFPRNVGSCSANDGSTNSYAKECDFVTELRHETLSESNKHMPVVESPRNVMQAYKLFSATGMVEESSDRSHRGQEPASIGNVAHQPKDSRNYNDNIGIEGVSSHKQDIKSDPNKLNVDEFGRLVREGVCDSDTSDSPHYTHRHARRARKRSRSQSGSRSPRDRRRRRSSWRRKDRRSQSRSLSPKRSRSRSPVLRRGNEFSGDRRAKGQLPKCFDFVRGKCYRGATCRYSHHELEKSERSRYNRGKQHHQDAPPRLWRPDFHESKVLPEKEIKDKGQRLPQDLPGTMEAKDAKRLPVDSTTDSPSKLDSMKSGSLLVADVSSNSFDFPAHDTPLGKNKSLVPGSAFRYSDVIPQAIDKQGKWADDNLVSESPAFVATSTHHPPNKSVGSPMTKHCSAEEVPPQSLKELLAPVASHTSQLTLPLPSASQAVSTPSSQPIAQDFKQKPAILQNHPENYASYQAPAAYQHFRFPGPVKSLPSSFFPPPPPPPPPTIGELITSSQHMQLSLLPRWDGLSSYTSTRVLPTELPSRSQTGGYQAYTLAQEPGRMLHSTYSSGSSSLHVSNLTCRLGGPRTMGEDGLTSHPMQGMNPSLAQAQPNALQMQSPLKETHGSVGGGLPSQGSRPYFQQASYGLQYSGTGGVVPSRHAEPGTVGSSASRINPDIPESSRPSYMHDSVESRISYYFNPNASAFDLPPSSKFSSNALIQENDTTISTKYAPVRLNTVPYDANKAGSLGSKNISFLPSPGDNQYDPQSKYDPLFDSIEPTSGSLSKVDHHKHETTGDSDDVLRLGQSGKVLDMEDINQEGETAASANDSLENEEYGETADVAVDADLNGTPSNPNDATDITAVEIEIDQVKTSGKKKRSKETSMKLFKISIATFVKEVLKPSWRQGNMSKEAFKTIVKKTVDKVSGAMKSHQIPKCQAKINHYIDSSRGKLTKLVMGYVDKYVKV